MEIKMLNKWRNSAAGDPYGNRTRVSAVETKFALNPRAVPPKAGQALPQDSAAFRGVGELSADFVYFIRAGRTPRIKIGWTLNPQKRLDALQTANPNKLNLIGFIPGDRVVEHDWHWQWRHLRVRGEWLDLTVELKTAINRRLSQPDATKYVQLSVFSRPRHAAGHETPVTMDELRAAMEKSEARCTSPCSPAPA